MAMLLDFAPTTKEVFEEERTPGEVETWEEEILEEDFLEKRKTDVFMNKTQKTCSSSFA